MKSNALKFIALVLICIVVFYVVENWNELMQKHSSTSLNESFTISDIRHIKAIDTSSSVYGRVRKITDYTITVEIVNNTGSLYVFTPIFTLMEANKKTTSNSTSYKVNQVGIGWHPKHYIDEKLLRGESCEYEINLDNFGTKILDGQYILNANGILIYFDFSYIGKAADGTIVDTQSQK